MQGQIFTTKATFCVYKKVPNNEHVFGETALKCVIHHIKITKMHKRCRVLQERSVKFVQLQGDYRRKRFHCMFSVWPFKTKFKHFCLKVRSDQDSLKYIRSKVLYLPEGLLY